ncbi:phosphoribosylglycinamide formyltransferase [Thermodesulfobacteriota bacterium]
MTKVGVLLSGSGSNFQSIIDNIKSGYIDASISVVISDNKDAYGLKRAQDNGIEVETVDYKSYNDRTSYDKHIVDLLNKHGAELVVLAGYMKVVTPFFVNAFKDRIMNIHPALLPSFPGLHVQKKALDYGAKFSGCTVHFVDEGVDTGPIIVQAVVPIFCDDTEESLSKRILKEEHKIYPLAIKLYVENRLKIEDRRVIITPRIDGKEAAIINPPVEQFR